MKNMTLFSKFLVLLLAVSVTAIGQTYTGSNPDVAVSKLVVASDSVPVNVPGNAVDGLPGTFAAIPGPPPAWIELDLGKFYYIDGYGLDLPSSLELPSVYTIQGSPDGAAWTDFGAGAPITAGNYGYNVPETEPYKYVRINMTSKHDPASFTEIHVYGDELLPPSAILALAPTDITNTSFFANWESVSGATGYRLDVATDIDFLDPVYGFDDLDVGNTIQKKVAGLPSGTTYYYRVRAYNLAGPSASSNKVSATTSKLSQNIIFNALPAKTYGDANFALTATASSGLPVTYTSSDLTVATVNGSNITIVGAGTTDITASQAGDAEYDPATPVVQDLVVNTLDLTVSGAVANNKEYDGTADATISGASLSGAIVTDDVSLDATVGTFAQSAIGTGIAVTAALTISGADAAKYTLTQPTGLTADITTKTLTVTGATAGNKVYDATADAVISGASLEGIVGDDVVTISGATSGTFAQSGVGTGIEVTTSITVAGADKDNYTVTQPAGLVADITAKELSVSGASVENKVYDASTVATITGATLAGIVGSDDVTVDVSNGTFAQAGVGTGIAVTATMTLSGTTAGNYSLTQPTGLSADITAKELTVTADDKSKEACEANPEFTVSYTGFAGSEDASVLTATSAASCAADENSPAGSYDIVVSGGSADNYTLVYVSGTLTVTADITDPELTVQDIVIQLDETGNATITPADLVTSASDNCAVADTTLSQSAFTNDDVGNVVVNVTVSDEAGNETTLPAIVQVDPATGFADMEGIVANIYPNPTDGMVHLEMTAGAERLKVMDMTGKTIINRSELQPQEVIDLTGYSKGVYILQLQAGDEMIHFRVVKK